MSKPGQDCINFAVKQSKTQQQNRSDMD